MKKSNLITLLSLILIIVAVVLFMSCGRSKVDIGTTATENSAKSSTVLLYDESTEKSETTAKAKETAKAPVSDDMLFIGDSRTVGLMEYAEIENADFFCNVGMSVYNIQDKTVSVPNVGKVTLAQLLGGKKYGKIYIMLGINEVGYELQSIVDKYSELIDFVKENQPDALIFIQGNLHVTQSRSHSDKVVNNTAIDRLNAELSKLADGKTTFYIDANKLFDDANGNLSADKSEDGTHLYAKYYNKWGKWIISQSASSSEEG